MMRAQPESDESLVRRLLPAANPDPADRAQAWAEWYDTFGGRAVLGFIRAQNHTLEPDEDILQDSLLTAYADVERGGYEQRAGVPFAAYVKGIARNKIREARRRQQRRAQGDTPLDALAEVPAEALARQVEAVSERRQRRQALWTALARLPLRQRLVLEQYLGGESLHAIALRLQITAELVRQDKHRGLLSLQRLGVFN